LKRAFLNLSSGSHPLEASVRSFAHEARAKKEKRIILPLSFHSIAIVKERKVSEVLV